MTGLCVDSTTCSAVCHQHHTTHAACTPPSARPVGARREVHKSPTPGVLPEATTHTSLSSLAHQSARASSQSRCQNNAVLHRPASLTSAGTRRRHVARSPPLLIAFRMQMGQCRHGWRILSPASRPHPLERSHEAGAAHALGMRPLMCSPARLPRVIRLWSRARARLAQQPASRQSAGKEISLKHGCGLTRCARLRCEGATLLKRGATPSSRRRGGSRR